MKTTFTLFMLISVLFGNLFAQEHKPVYMHEVPVEIKIMVNEAPPLKGKTFDITMEVTPLVAVKSAKASFATSDKLSLQGQREFAVNGMNANAKRTFKSKVSVNAYGRAILTANFEIVTTEGYTFSASKSLYFLLNKENTFYADEGFIAAQSDSIKYRLKSSNLSTEQYEKEYKKALKKVISGAVTSDTTSANKTRNRDDAKKNEEGISASSTITISGTINWTAPDGSLHPVKFASVEVWDEDVLIDELLATVTTDANGMYAASIATAITDNPDVYIKAFAKSGYCYVVKPGEGEEFTYSVATTVIPDVVANTTVSLTIPNNKDGLRHEPYNAFSVYAAMVESAEYVKNIDGAALAKIPVRFPGSGSASYYHPSEKYLSILFERFFAWDVLHHEYGHYVAHSKGIADLSVGGPHSIDGNLAETRPKADGFKFAWSEAWPTYFAISLQRDRGINIPSVGAGNTNYENQAGLTYSIESLTPYPSKGEDNELAVQRIIWDIYDSNSEPTDEISLGGNAVWQVLNNVKPAMIFDAWKGFTNGKPLKDVVKYGSIFAEHKVASLPTLPADGTSLTTLENDVDFTWDANGAGPSYKNNEFTVEFYNKDFTKLIFTSPKSASAAYKATPADLKKIFVTEREVAWLVKSSNTSAPVTGPYTSPAFTLKGEPTGVDIVFVIDDTGSMGEEINGVKNALTSILATYENDTSGTVFQLVTYKDGVNQRAPTTDLALIKSQVEGLFASGGGDCPEASIQALSAIIDHVKIGGVVFHATDASPHPGLSMEGLLASAKTRKVSISTLLSGDCGGTMMLAAASKESTSQNTVPYSDNKDAEAMGAALSATTVASAGLNAIEAFSLIARETGGLFAFVPEVNYGNPADIQKYENIAFNLIQGGLTLSISSVDPGSGPKGARMVVTINGSRTSFNSSSTVTFEESGISVEKVTLISPTKLQAFIVIPSEEKLGFRNIQVITKMEGGGTETAKGTGVFQVKEAPTLPTILSIAPSSAAAGQSLEVSVSGINTNFSSDSKLDLGAGITVISASALGKDLLVANIKISRTADTGFRNVVVTTGSEVATENVFGPFLVIGAAMDCDLSELNAGANQPVYLGYTPYSCTTLSVNGLVEDELDEYEFLWSTGETTASINVCPTETTTYSVSITRGSCTVTDEVKVCVIDVRCGPENASKVQVCHNPTGQPGKEKVLCISEKDVQDHLNHGDKLGACGTAVSCDDSDEPLAAARRTDSSKTDQHQETIKVKKVYPNPSNGRFTVALDAESAEVVALEVYDKFGRLFHSESVKVEPGTSFVELNMQHLSRGPYYLKIKNKVVSTQSLLIY